MSDHAKKQAILLSRHLRSVGWRMATAESCTGGGIADLITSIPGASQWYAGSVVCYADQVKHEVLGVREEALRRDGAVSEEVVRQMADGVLELMHAELSVAVSGIAGPDGGTEDKPVGTVWFAWRCKEESTIAELCLFEGDRRRIREQAVLQALHGMVALLRRPGITGQAGKPPPI